ncbi:MAG: 2,3-bisphosphoglycerate-independent phosphoglycerate mutase, partial [Planctomycetota bacterium]|nr:2,3-bisphosphoglycerate-independent phosphoglycerate mutase [Planctomycetota bacterium]
MADRTSSTTPVVLIIRDGWGQNPNPEHRKFNAITLAKTPFDEKLRREWPSTLIRTCGEDVGLPLGVMGNSEVGHQNIGAGRIVNQELLRIRQAIHEGSFFENPALGEAIEHAKKNNRALHLMGLVSDGQVHSDLEHLLALIDMAAHVDFPPDRLFLHAFTDGRDTSPFTGKEFLHRVQRHMKTKGLGRIASICGRYFAMDRDHRWQRVAQAYRCLTGKNVEHPLLNDHDGGCKSSPDADLVIQRYYDEPSDENCRGDEFILPTQIVDEDGRPIGLIQDDDAVI